LRFNFPWYLDPVPRFARHPPLTGKVGPHEHETPVQSQCGVALLARWWWPPRQEGVRVRRAATAAATGFAVSSRRLGPGRHRVRMFERDQPASRRTRMTPRPEQRRSSSEDIRRASAAPTSTARPAQRASVVIRRLGTTAARPAPWARENRIAPSPTARAAAAVRCQFTARRRGTAARSTPPQRHARPIRQPSGCRGRPQTRRTNRRKQVPPRSSYR